MRFQNLLFVFIFATSFLSAGNPALPAPRLSTTALNPEFSCGVAAPTNFHIVSVGTTWFKLAWDYQPFAAGGYRVRTYRSSDNALISTLATGQDNTIATVSDLSPGEEYYCVINSRCASWEEGTDTAQTAPRHALILELVVDAYSIPNNASSCTINTTESVCSYQENLPMYFSVSNAVAIGHFKMENGKCHLPAGNNTNTKFKFYCDGSGVNPNCYATANILVRYRPGVIETDACRLILEYVQASGTYKLSVAQINYPFQINKLDRPQFHGSGDEGAGLEIAPESAPLAAPNPFNDELTCQFSAESDTKASTVALYDLQGHQVIRQEVPSGISEASFNTADLAPGLYFLSVQTGDEAPTMMKVMKL